ncbi:hypothetical protein M2323_001221 [Rhodoblastus acidophilus]|uniref:hypothetical protein n=1 Tax=Rhodoblastus acidophilus TaxID=1074 RepID=UPI0022249D04|nr:hypothetical protein [Rhodoblastus acidophilus]MCW2283365.1 hypothetical protein [Rhodoblastus acidophilus]MCW2332311.1 hypothetical protein [Rhodoblastus acidophilus]
MSDRLQIFIPLRKADAAQRLVYGYATAESPDRAGEICDYASTKPQYQAWSKTFAKATDGRSLGNVRAMHGAVAAGKIASIRFNDAEKRIEIAAKIIDDDEWRKVEEGVYTGFSQGGVYLKRWPDPENPDLVRYTAKPSEISLVDLPCLPEASFELVKADGACETRAFAHKTPNALRDWLTGNIENGAPAAEIIGDFFDAIAHDINADPIHDEHISVLLSRLKSKVVAAMQPRPAQKFAADPRVEKLSAETDALRKLTADLRPKLADLAARIEALEQTPAPPPLIPGYAAVSKSSESGGLEALAAELARLSPAKASLVLIKAAQSQPKRFG